MLASSVDHANHQHAVGVNDQQLAYGANMAIRQGATETWTKSSYSTTTARASRSGRPLVEALDVGDSKVPEGPKLAFPADAWNAFVASVKA